MAVPPIYADIQTSEEKATAAIAKLHTELQSLHEKYPPIGAVHIDRSAYHIEDSLTADRDTLKSMGDNLLVLTTEYLSAAKIMQESSSKARQLGAQKTMADTLAGLKRMAAADIQEGHHMRTHLGPALLGYTNELDRALKIFQEQLLKVREMA